MLPTILKCYEMEVGLSPPYIRVTAIVMPLTGSVNRVLTEYISLTTWQPMKLASMAKCGSITCPLFPWIVMVNLFEFAVTYSAGIKSKSLGLWLAIWRAKQCSTLFNKLGYCYNNLDAPPHPSSPGWKHKIISLFNTLLFSAISLAAVSNMAVWASCPHAWWSPLSLLYSTPDSYLKLSASISALKR